MTKMGRVRIGRGLYFLRRGMRVFSTHNQKWGTITGANDSGNINVRFDGDKFSQNCHPYFKLSYYNKEGLLIKKFDD